MTENGFEEFHFLSADGHTGVYACYRLPEGTPRAILQISHGMCEYVGRYGDFADYFTKAGFIVCGNDHLGHGHTAADPEELGFTAVKNGADFLVEDLHTMTVQMKTRFPGLPVFLFGHSMGSFAARLYLSRYGKEVDGAVISGTAGPGSPTGLGLFLCALLTKFHGAHYRSKFVWRMAFGAYNKRFKEENDPVSWLTADKKVRENYLADPLCNYSFTLAGYQTLLSLLRAISSKKWAKTLPPELPVLLSSGTEDPVGNYAKGVRKVYERLLAAGVSKTGMNLYEGGRHEPHNDLMRETALADDLLFLNTVLGDKEKNDL